MTYPPGDNIVEAIQLYRGVRYYIPAAWWPAATLQDEDAAGIPRDDGHTLWFKYLVSPLENFSWYVSNPLDTVWQFFDGVKVGTPTVFTSLPQFINLPSDLNALSDYENTYNSLTGLSTVPYADAIAFYGATPGWVYFMIDTRTTGGTYYSQSWVQIGTGVPPLRMYQRTDALAGGPGRQTHTNRSLQSRSARAAWPGSYL